MDKEITKIQCDNLGVEGLLYSYVWPDFNDYGYKENFHYKMEQGQYFAALLNMFWNGKVQNDITFSQAFELYMVLGSSKVLTTVNVDNRLIYGFYEYYINQITRWFRVKNIPAKIENQSEGYVTTHMRPTYPVRSRDIPMGGHRANGYHVLVDLEVNEGFNIPVLKYWSKEDLGRLSDGMNSFFLKIQTTIPVPFFVFLPSTFPGKFRHDKFDRSLILENQMKQTGRCMGVVPMRKISTMAMRKRMVVSKDRGNGSKEIREENEIKLVDQEKILNNQEMMVDGASLVDEPIIEEVERNSVANDEKESISKEEEFALNSTPIEESWDLTISGGNDVMEKIDKILDNGEEKFDELKTSSMVYLLPDMIIQLCLRTPIDSYLVETNIVSYAKNLDDKITRRGLWSDVRNQYKNHVHRGKNNARINSINKMRELASDIDFPNRLVCDDISLLMPSGSPHGMAIYMRGRNPKMKYYYTTYPFESDVHSEFGADLGPWRAGEVFKYTIPVDLLIYDISNKVNSNLKRSQIDRAIRNKKFLSESLSYDPIVQNQYTCDNLLLAIYLSSRNLCMGGCLIVKIGAIYTYKFEIYFQLLMSMFMVVKVKRLEASLLNDEHYLLCIGYRGQFGIGIRGIENLLSCGIPLQLFRLLENHVCANKHDPMNWGSTYISEIRKIAKKQVLSRIDRMLYALSFKFSVDCGSPGWREEVVRRLEAVPCKWIRLKGFHDDEKSSAKEKLDIDVIK